MTTALRWIETTGGPHLLIAEELLAYWRGIDGWRNHRDPTDRSDYSRACRITTWLGPIACHDGTALVLSGDVGPIAWTPNPSESGGYLLQWLGVDDESLIEAILQSDETANLLNMPDAEELNFTTGSSGKLRLIDASEAGNNLRDATEVLALRPGNYRIRAAYVNKPNVMIVVRQISSI